jgi:L-alanine-DL-glutamate epimerase-like enolase superfamily enzyme
MKVTKIELYHCGIPLKKAFYPSWIPDYPQTVNRFTFLKITTDNDLVGTAAGMAFEEEREGLGSVLGSYLLGIDPCNIDLIHQRLKELTILGWRNFWMEAAFYDLWAQAEDKPLWQLLGGTDKPIPAYWSTGSVINPKKHAKVCQQAVDEGYQAIKLRVKRRTLEEDVKGVQEVRKRFGNSEFPIAVDANMGWNVTIIGVIPDWTLERAKQFIDQTKEQNLWWLEEPLDWHKYEDYAELREHSASVGGPKIAGGELNYGWHELRMFMHFKSLDLYQPDATFSGIKDSIKTIKATREQNLGFNPHTWTNGFGLVVNMHVYSLTDREYPLEYPHEPGTWTPEVRDGMMKAPITPKMGYLELPQEAGLGAPLDWEKIEQHGRKYFQMTEGDLKKKVIKEKGLIAAMKLKRAKSKGEKSWES